MSFGWSFFGDEIDAIRYVDPITGATLQSMESLSVYPAKHFVTPDERIDEACNAIQEELREQLEYLEKEGKLLEAQRLEQRTRYDLEMIREVGYCNGVEKLCPASGWTGRRIAAGMFDRLFP